MKRSRLLVVSLGAVLALVAGGAAPADPAEVRMSYPSVADTVVDLHGETGVNRFVALIRPSGDGSGPVWSVDLELRRMGAPASGPSLLAVSARQRGQAPFAFSANDCPGNQPTGGAQGAVRNFDLIEFQAYLSARMVSCRVSPDTRGGQAELLQLDLDLSVQPGRAPQE